MTWVSTIGSNAPAGSEVYAVSRSFISTTPLLANGTISAVIANLDVRRIVGTAYSDHAGVLTFESSVDGISWLGLDPGTPDITVGATTVSYTHLE